MSDASKPVYLAWSSGHLSYDCAPCGKCCRGLGIADDPVHLRESPELSRLSAFAADLMPDLPLVTLYTYGGGCRYLATDNGCGLHRDAGPQAKPHICRLFPFSKLVDVDGLWVVLPHHLCPWQAATKPDDPLSLHENVLADLDADLLARLTPLVMVPRTPMAAEARRDLEADIRDATADLSDPHEAIRIATRLQRDAGIATLEAPEDETLWLDMLRCAGEPPPLPPALARLFVTALPALRIQLTPQLPMPAIPVALLAFELCLRSLAELHLGDLSGEDLLLLLDRRAPILTLMAYAESPLPHMNPEELGDPDLAALAEELNERDGEALGPALLAVLRSYEQGALSAMMRIGAELAGVLGTTDAA